MTTAADDLRHMVENLLRSDLLRQRTHRQPSHYLCDTLRQLCRETQLEVTVVRVDAGSSAEDYVLVWKYKLDGPLEEQPFSLRRRGARRPVASSHRQLPRLSSRL